MNAILQKSNVWDSVLERVEKRLNRQIFDSWFLPIQFDGIDQENKTISLCCGRVTKDWVCLYYSGMIEQTLSEIEMDGYSVAVARLDVTIDAVDCHVESAVDEPTREGGLRPIEYGGPVVRPIQSSRLRCPKCVAIRAGFVVRLRGDVGGSDKFRRRWKGSVFAQKILEGIVGHGTTSPAEVVTSNWHRRMLEASRGLGS